VQHSSRILEVLEKIGRAMGKSKGTLVIVRDNMQRGYRHRTEPPGKNFALDFTPDLTPREMLALGVFSGKYLSDCRECARFAVRPSQSPTFRHLAVRI
jgi:hypothetical protein